MKIQVVLSILCAAVVADPYLNRCAGQSSERNFESAFAGIPDEEKPKFIADHLRQTRQDFGDQMVVFSYVVTGVLGEYDRDERNYLNRQRADVRQFAVSPTMGFYQQKYPYRQRITRHHGETRSYCFEDHHWLMNVEEMPLRPLVPLGQSPLAFEIGDNCWAVPPSGNIAEFIRLAEEKLEWCGPEEMEGLGLVYCLQSKTSATVPRSLTQVSRYYLAHRKGKLCLVGFDFLHQVTSLNIAAEGEEQEASIRRTKHSYRIQYDIFEDYVLPSELTSLKTDELLDAEMTPIREMRCLLDTTVRVKSVDLTTIPPGEYLEIAEPKHARDVEHLGKKQ